MGKARAAVKDNGARMVSQRGSVGREKRTRRVFGHHEHRVVLQSDDGGVVRGYGLSIEWREQGGNVQKHESCFNVKEK